MRKTKGFTLIEIVVVLAIIAVIAAFLTPMLFDYLKESKVSRAKVDVINIAASIANFNRDLQIYPIYKTDTTQANASVVVLHTAEGNQATATGETVTGWIGAANTTTIQTLDTALHDGKLADGSILYSAVVKRPGQWKGPYMTDFKADPWGNKYYVSTEGLKPGNTKTAFVLSAGPNGTIETFLTQDMAATASGTPTFGVGGDDIVYRIK